MFDRLNLNEKKYKIIPIDWGTLDNFYTITFEGWKNFTFVQDDETCNELIEVCAQTIHTFIKIYKDTHALTQPVIGYKPDGTVFIKIGTMKNERYEERLAAYNGKNEKLKCKFS